MTEDLKPEEALKYYLNSPMRIADEIVSGMSAKAIASQREMDGKDLSENFTPCSSCGGENTIEKFPDHIHENKETGVSVKAPAYSCTRCGQMVYLPGTYKTILEAEEVAQGRPYARVHIKLGEITRYSIH